MLSTISPRRYEEPPHPFSTVAGLFDGYKLPAASIDPMGEWEQHWGVYSIGFNPVRSGSLRMHRKPEKIGTAILIIDYRKKAPGGFINHTHAELECHLDTLSTPVRWTVQYAIRTAAGQAVPNSQWNMKGHNEIGRITIEDSSGKRVLPPSGSLSTFWCLFEAVHRLPKTSFAPVKFTSLDEFDQPVAGHTLSFREDADFPINHPRKSKPGDMAAILKENEELKKTPRKRIRVVGYEQAGPGILPMTYWTGEDNRLLFAIGGIEAHVWEQPNAQENNAT